MLNASVKTKEGIEEVKAYTVDEYMPKLTKWIKTQRFKKVYLYCTEFATLDTETSHTDDEGWVYQWAFYFNHDFVIGRKPSEFIQLLEKLSEFYKLNDQKKICIYVHNISYDFAYLKQFLIQYDENISVLAIDNHSIIQCDIFGFRLLCSYKLSNMSLDLFSNTYAEKYIKASGAIDYNIVRYQDTDLTAIDWHYMLSDVASQHDAITHYLHVNGYEYASHAPITSTGFVRTDCRHAAEKDRKWRQEFISGRLSLPLYNMLRQAFMGGITISSYRYNGEVVENVSHKDFTSSYPARQMMDYFPKGKASKVGAIKTRKELDYYLRTYCCIFILSIENVHIKEGITAPYIPSSKCIELIDELKVNGKIVFAERLTMAITEIDFKWIEKQYDFENMKVLNLHIFERGDMPAWLKNRIMKFYDDKCKLKKSDPRLYMCSKAKLNGIYGMSATTIIREQYEMDSSGIISHKSENNEEKEKRINKFYNSYNSFMPYQLGVWTTAHARNALMEMIEAVGYDNFIYCDTDSVFYKSNEESEKNLKAMNEEIKKRAIKAGAYIDDNYLGYATDEPHIRKFKSLHAKCYAMEELNEKTGEYELKVTIAGVPKKSVEWVNGAPVTFTNSEELGAVENLKDGFTFKHCGGTRCLYVEDDIRNININGHDTELASSAIIMPIEKTISDTMYIFGKDYSILDYKFEQIYE